MTQIHPFIPLKSSEHFDTFYHSRAAVIGKQRPFAALSTDTLGNEHESGWGLSLNRSGRPWDRGNAHYHGPRRSNQQASASILWKDARGSASTSPWRGWTRGNSCGWCSTRRIWMWAFQANHEVLSTVLRSSQAEIRYGHCNISHRHSWRDGSKRRRTVESPYSGQASWRATTWRRKIHDDGHTEKLRNWIWCQDSECLRWSCIEALLRALDLVSLEGTRSHQVKPHPGVMKRPT